MPYLPPTNCEHLGCRNTADQTTRRCHVHQHEARRRRDGSRKSPTERGYDRRWRAYAKAFLIQHPWCGYCAQRGTQTRATCVDHVDAPLGDMAKFWDPNNHRAACKSCNSRKAVREEGALGRDNDDRGSSPWGIA